MTKQDPSDNDDSSSSSFGHLHSPTLGGHRSLTAVNPRSSFSMNHNRGEHPMTTTEEDASEELAVAAALLQQSPGLRRRTSHWFDVTAGGTTARLHSSLAGHGVTTPFAPFQANDEDDESIEETTTTLSATAQALAQSSSLQHPHAPCMARQERGDEQDPEKTPLLGGPPSVAARRAQQVDDETFPPNHAPTANRDKIQSQHHHQANKAVTLWHRVLGQIPAITLIGLFHLMIGIPFGVSYFPVGWRAMDADASTATHDDGVAGPFPLPAKEAVGIRMFLFSTAVGQLVFTFQSQFPNAIGLQMVENVPFCQALATIVIQHQGYGANALSTILIIFAASSIVVGSVFWVLGRYRLGRVIYFFPTHVLIGCIGGIGLFLARTAMEVAMDHVFDWVTLFGEKLHLVGVVFGFELVLRILQRLSLDAAGESRYPLLSPVYFCMITPVFYGILWITGIGIDSATDMGYFFPPLDNGPDDGNPSLDESNIWSDVFVLWTVLDFRNISWAAIWDAIPTMVALTLFSLIHVPINIPAFAISSNREVDINNELVAHGFSNLVMGFAGGGGLQNYMAYTQSVLYARSGGFGKASGVTVALVTVALFLVGPTIAWYIPRCMAGCLLLHVGIDLFLEAVYDSIGRFDYLEYAGIWLIVGVMAVAGLEAAMIAGVIAAVSTYAVQSMTYLNPIRGTMSAATLRSSQFDRSREANHVLDDPLTGRSRILVVQLQGHLFFGNTAQLTEFMQQVVQTDDDTTTPWIVILDFMLVLGIDSSAAQAMGKLRTILRKQFDIDPCIFVTGSQEGFPTAFGLSKELSQPVDRFSGSRVVPDLDTALTLAEDALLARHDPSLLLPTVHPLPLAHKDSGLTEERDVALKYLSNIAVNPDADTIQGLFTCFDREVYAQDEIVWRQGAPGDSSKLVVRGTLIAVLEQEAGTSEVVGSGNVIGELGLVYGSARMSTVMCCSEECVLYSLSREKYEDLVEREPHVARIMDLICIKYLSGRVQHVSNRIFETRCLPI